MPTVLPTHVQQLREYLLQPSERNEDLAIGYFRKLYPDTFRRQSDAANADGYVPGHFVLELKGDPNGWYAALFQALAYEGKGLSFSLIVVCTRGFLALWRKMDIPEAIREAIVHETAAPSTVGRKYAKKYLTSRKRILQSAIWYRPELSGALFVNDDIAFLDSLRGFEKAILRQRLVRQSITVQNFGHKLKELKQFFDPSVPTKTVRAFYSMIYGPWDESSVLSINQRRDDRATLGGIEVTDLVPNKRNQFKSFVESHAIQLRPSENIDDFFSRFDEALDAVDTQFRIRNGIFFTDLNLSKFTMWVVRQYLPSLGRNYLVIDPACGSGNLVTNWRSPLELRHKVVSDIEPELLFAVEQRMKGDQWHQGKFTVVPKVSESVGLNFLDKSASEYLEILRHYLAAKGHKPDKPLAFLCNPPYRSDDDQAADAISYQIHSDIVDLVGKDAASERYCCFLAQMQLICDAAVESGLPEDSVLLLFTKMSWLTDRPVFAELRRRILGSFEDLGGLIVNGREFFDLKGTFPIAFTMWRYRGPNANLDANRSIPLVDLTDVKHSELAAIPWHDSQRLDSACAGVWNQRRNRSVYVGMRRARIRDWVGQTMTDFKRNRRRDEVGVALVGGLPAGDRRMSNSKAYGEQEGTIVGFMDDLTPCRTIKGVAGMPWFRLNPQIMDVRKNRLYSGPPSHFGYCAHTRSEAETTFIWYAIARTFASTGYPMWADPLELWPPELGARQRLQAIKFAFSIAFAENECVEIVFPAGNPTPASIEVLAPNPLTPLNAESFWSKELASVFTTDGLSGPDRLVSAVTAVFECWRKVLHGRNELIVEYSRPYFIGEGRLTIGAGLVQVRDYANEVNHAGLLDALNVVQQLLRVCREQFRDLLIDANGIDYFGHSAHPSANRNPVVARQPSDSAVAGRLAVTCTLVNRLADDPHFGRTKLAKLFYLVDASLDLGLDTSYVRQAAGPLDAAALYNAETGLEALAVKHGYLTVQTAGRKITYIRGPHLDLGLEIARKRLGSKRTSINRLIDLFRKLDTNQCEIVATLYACWNDRLRDRQTATDATVIKEFLTAWHERKRRFQPKRLMNALRWMKAHNVVPTGAAPHTRRR
jgi:hypothetical protein